MESSLIVKLGKHFAGGCTDFVVWVKKLGLEGIYRRGSIDVWDERENSPVKASLFAGRVETNFVKAWTSWSRMETFLSFLLDIQTSQVAGYLLASS